LEWDQNQIVNQVVSHIGNTWLTMTLLQTYC